MKRAHPREADEPEHTAARSRFWLRPLAIALVGVLLLGSAGVVATHFVHADLPSSSVSCLDSTCTSGMPMSSGSTNMRDTSTSHGVKRSSEPMQMNGASPTASPSNPAEHATPSR